MLIVRRYTVLVGKLGSESYIVNVDCADFAITVPHSKVTDP